MTHDTHITPPKPKRARLITAIVSLLIIPISIITYTLTAQSPPTPPPNPEGTYLALAGNGCIIISRDESGALIASGSIMDDRHIRLRMSDANLVIESRFNLDSFAKSPYFERPALPEDNQPWDGYFELVPSPERPGDWNLVKYRSPYTLFNAKYDSFDTMMDDNFEWPPLQPPEPLEIPQFLHRLDDPNLINFFEARNILVNKGRGDPTPLHSVAVSLLAAHPDDLWIRLLYLDTLLQIGDWQTLAAKLNSWEQDFLASPNPDIRDRVATLRHALHVAELSESKRNAFDYIHEHLSGDNAGGLNQRIAALPGLMQYTDYASPLPTMYPRFGPDLLSAQILIKTFRVQSEFNMLQGRYDESWDILKGAYHWGGLYEQDPNLIHQIIGCALRTIIILPTEVLCFNAPLDDAKLSLIQTQIDVWARQALIPLPEDLEMKRMKRYHISSISSMMSKEARFYYAHGRLVNLMVGIAGWRHFQREGRLPRFASEFLWPEGVSWPLDPFHDQEREPDRKIQWTNLNNGSALQIWSIGPDKTDQQGAIEYDPTNGTVSAGDITLLVPRDRKYPFKPGGVRAKSRDDFISQFPSGLPRDLFADRAIGYSVADTRPVRVFSFGPDTDQNVKLDERNQPQPGMTFDPYYDPTNGVISDGDIWIEIPAP